nr:hypothetical protein [Allomuricauda sp.]
MRLRLLQRAWAFSQTICRIIVVDGLGYTNVVCQGVKDVVTLNIDHIAESGIQFKDAIFESGTLRKPHS